MPLTMDVHDIEVLTSYEVSTSALGRIEFADRVAALKRKAAKRRERDPACGSSISEHRGGMIDKDDTLPLLDLAQI